MSAAQNFAMFAAQYDEAIRAGADAAMNAGLARLTQLMPYFLTPMVIMWGVLGATGQLGWGRLLSYLLRLAFFLWLVVGLAYVPVIRNTVVDDIPNEIATVVNGGGATITSAQQFDALDEATAHFVANIKAQATGIFAFPTRLTADAARGYAKFWLELIFYIWIIVRMATYLLVASMAFMMLFVLFDSTRGWVMSMVGKMVGVSVWQLMTSILLAVQVAGMQVYLRSAIANPGASIDEQLENAWDIGGWFLGCFVLLLVVPSLSGFGAGYVAAGAQGAIFGAVGTAGRLAASGGAALGSRTAGTLRRIARNTASNASKGSRA